MHSDEVSPHVLKPLGAGDRFSQVLEFLLAQTTKRCFSAFRGHPTPPFLRFLRGVPATKDVALRANSNKHSSILHNQIFLCCRLQVCNYSFPWHAFPL